MNLATRKGTAGDADGDTLVSIEAVIGSDHDDTFIASAGVDVIDGGGNPDMMPAGDTVSYELSEDGVTVVLGAIDAEGTAQVDAAEDSYAAGDILTDIENLTGSTRADSLTGNGAANTLKGGGGNDTLLAGEGGDDKLYGGAGNDTMTGGAGNDTLMGGAGRDIMSGGLEHDTLVGGAGDDELTGDAGTDTFVFGLGDGDDIINDFIMADDRIDLSAFGLDEDELIALIQTRGVGDANVRVQIDLTSVGGGTIELTTIDELGDLGELDGQGNLMSLDLVRDTHDVGGGTGADGMITVQDDGIFIL